MNWKVHVLMAVVIAAVAVPSGLLAQTPDAVLATEALSSSTRALFIAEMQAVATAMGRIHHALVIGDHQIVVSEAQRIHDSFVLAQELNEDQRREIGSKLPPAFLSADHSFHVLSARLVDAATRGDARLERVWFDEMTRACLTCHRAFAAKRFVGLSQGDDQ